MLLGIYETPMKSTSMPDSLPDTCAVTRCPTAQAIRKGLWNVAADETLGAEEDSLSCRIVTLDVWFKDDMVGRSSDGELAHLPKMSVAGVGLIADRIEALNEQHVA